MMNVTLTTTQPKTLVSVQFGAPMIAAAEIMNTHKIRHLPVCEGSQIVGILSDRDVQRASRTDLYQVGGKRVEWSNIDPNYLVQDFMTSPVICVDTGESIEAVADKMLSHHVSSLLVTQKGAPVGIITTEDLLRIITKKGDPKVKTLWSLFTRVKAGFMQSPVGTIVEELSWGGI